MKIKIIPLAVVLLYTASCSTPSKKSGLYFTSLPAATTGIDFNNIITEDDSLNMFVNEYTYMGAGIGVADFNNDGLPDVFFAGNQASSQLYINKGNLQFENSTKTAGLVTHSWCTGVSIVDINNDGWADIYVTVSGKTAGPPAKNLLFINRHNLHFTEEAAAYGLDFSGYSTQAAFFDYDGDGRLDMYLLNHTLEDRRPNDIRDTAVDTHSAAADKLYHNEGNAAGTDHPLYKDVSAQAGIAEDGNGLGLVISDVNGDGYPDIYVANDYVRNDLLWLNDKNGHFTDCSRTALQHQAYSSMGTDAADINNDGLPDVINLDMQPATNQRKKMMYSFLNDQRAQLELNKGYAPQFIHNMLQLNYGTRTVNHRETPFFSEIAEMAGIAETDWSWSVLAADFNNDGWKDIHITNGLGRDPTNIDFLEYRHNTVVQSGIPDNDSRQRRGFIDQLAALGPVLLTNYLFLGKDGYQFEDVSAAAGITTPSISNGAVYADLDNDGDLDIITSNINSPAFLLRNDLINGADTATGHWLSIKLNGALLNKDGIGTRVIAYSRGIAQVLEQYPVRGYLSSVDNRLHFGAAADFDSVRINWPGNHSQLITKPGSNRFISADYAAAGVVLPVAAPLPTLLFEDVTAAAKASFRHQESFFFDYAFQPLLQQKYSQEGPFISTGDVNGDGLEDFFIGGAFKQSGKIFLQQPDGSFAGRDLVTGTKNEEDMQSVLFDADGDHDLDLLVVSGSTEFDANSSFYQPRLYINDGKGNFKKDPDAFMANIRTPGKCIAAADMDGDGDMDIFIGGRVALGTYPQPPRSYLLRNEHGKFTDVTAAVCPALMNPGLLNAAIWADLDNDKKPDLIIAGDWMPLRIFKNNGRSLQEISAAAGVDSLPGFWRSLQLADIDNDGDADIVAGNLGLNNPFHINGRQPAELVAKDFDGNGVVEPVFCYYIKDNTGAYRLSAGISRDEWAVQMPSIKKRFDHNAGYANAGMEEIFTADMMQGSQVFTCKEVRSGCFVNNGRGSFSFQPLPLAAQVAPVNTIVCKDFTGDGKPDLVVAGNEYQSQVMAGRYDAAYGLLLTGNGRGDFNAHAATGTGLLLEGDTRDCKILTAGRQMLLLAGVNNQDLKVFRIGKK